MVEGAPGDSVVVMAGASGQDHWELFLKQKKFKILVKQTKKVKTLVKQTKKFKTLVKRVFKKNVVA